jgi:hypothetical protein
VYFDLDQYLLCHVKFVFLRTNSGNEAEVKITLALASAFIPC